jgi:hypothetical protein
MRSGAAKWKEKGTMRRHALPLSIVILGLVGALAGPVGAQAATAVRSFPQEFVTPICNSDVLQMSGTLVNVEHQPRFTRADSISRTVPVTGTATDLTTGTIFHRTTFFQDLESRHRRVEVS